MIEENKQTKKMMLSCSPHTGSSSQPPSNGSPPTPTPNSPWFYCLAWCHILWSISLVILGQLCWMGCFHLLLYTQFTHCQGSIRRYSTAKTSVLSTLFSSPNTTPYKLQGGKLTLFQPKPGHKWVLVYGYMDFSE